MACGGTRKPQQPQRPETKIRITDADESVRVQSVRLPACMRVGDVFQLGTCLYKITSLDNKEFKGEAIYCRKVKKDSFRSRR